VFRCFLRSEGCVLVPRSSGTPVATWAWATWVVSRRRVLEAVFILLEFPSPSRRIYIGSHSLPPSLVRRIGPSVMVLSCIRPSKRAPSQRKLHRNCEMPPCGHTGDALRGWSHSHLSPTDTLSPVGRYGSALAELNSALTPLLTRWGVQKSYRQVDPLAFRPGQAHVVHPQVRPQHLGSENCQSRDT
jgi:hypothetical protein